jgi:hypothetical protein
VGLSHPVTMCPVMPLQLIVPVVTLSMPGSEAISPVTKSSPSCTTLYRTSSQSTPSQSTLADTWTEPAEVRTVTALVLTVFFAADTMPRTTAPLKAVDKDGFAESAA